MPRAKTLRWVLIAGLVLAAAAGREAGAAPPKESARSYYDKATSAFGLGDYDQAAELYEKAFQLRADSALLYDAAQAHRMAGHKERALQLYRNYVRLFPDSKQTPDARRHIDELQAGATAPPLPPTSPALAPIGAAGTGPGQPPAASSGLVLTPAPPPPAPGPTAPGGDLTKSASPPDGTADGRKRSTWIWIAVGGAAVVAGAITTALLLGGSAHDPTPSLGTVPGAGAP